VLERKQKPHVPQTVTKLRIALAIALSSLLFAWSHTGAMGLPWLLIFGMGIVSNDSS
jgi:membrane protease YdiL (CAAX protease family)